MSEQEQVTYFAETDARGKRVPFGIKAKDRTKHMYVIGKTGMGKSTLLENMAIQDIKNGNGLCFVDPHGKTAELLLEYVPKERMKDVLYFAPFDLDHPISFNIMEDVGYDKRHLVVSGLMSAFRKIWVDAWSARMEYILTNTILALLEYPDSTLLSVNRVLTDKAYRKKVVDNITDATVKSFWVDEFAKYTDRFTAEATPAIQNKVGQFTSNPVIRNIIGQPKSSFDLRDIMDNKKILIVNLSKGRVGETNANLLGSMLITKIYLAAMSRADAGDQAVAKMPNFYLFVDEFQSFANESFADILSEARKYKLNLTMAHQYIEQMAEEVRSAVFGNVGTMITFRVGAYDADVLEKEFAPVFLAEDLVNLGFTQIYLKLMIDGVSSTPFSATTLPPLPHPEESYVTELIHQSQSMFGKPRAGVEKAILDWYNAAPTTGDSTSPDTPKQSSPISHKKDKPKVQTQNQEHKRSAHRSIDTSESKATPPDTAEDGRTVFAKALEKAVYEKKDTKQDTIHNKSEQPVSLSVLRDDRHKPAHPAPERVSTLKEAISQLIQKHPEKQKHISKKDNKTQSQHTKSTGRNTDTNSSHNTPSDSSVKKEIPESQLRKIFSE